MTSITRHGPIARNNDATRIGSDAELAAFLRGAIPLAVGSSAGLMGPDGKALGQNTVAFQMQSADGNKKVDVAWDKDADKLYALKEGKMVEASPEVRAAALERLTANDLKGRFKNSRYSLMRDDMIKVKESAVTPQKPPQLPATTTSFDSDAFYQDLQGDNDASKNKVSVETQQTQTQQTQTQQTQTQQTQKQSKTQETPSTSITKPTPVATTTQDAKPTSVSLEAFVEKNRDRSMSVAALEKNGAKNAYHADLDGDGVIRGEAELRKLFSISEAPDRNGDKNIADLTHAETARRFAAIDKTADTTSAYGARQLANVKQGLEDGQIFDSIQPLTEAEAKNRGLSRGTLRLTVEMSKDGGDMGNRQHKLEIFYDPSTKRFYKEYFNDSDGVNTPMVPLSAAEIATFKGRKEKFEVGGVDTKEEADMVQALTGKRPQIWVHADPLSGDA